MPPMPPMPPVPRGHQVPTDILAGPHQVTGGFLLDAGHGDRATARCAQSSRTAVSWTCSPVGQVVARVRVITRCFLAVATLAGAA